jgi:predicted HTH transcriptional regulator
MWIPKDEEEIRNALLNHSIEEGPSFDVKREIPKSNAEIAKDISAMAIDGGVLIYGIGEDEKNVNS